MEIRYLISFLSEWMGAVAVIWILSSLPAFKRPQLGFRFPRREGIMALSMFALITLFAFLVFRANPPTYLHDQPLPAPTAALPQAFVIAGLSLIPVVVALLARGQPVRSAGWDPARLRIALQLGVAIALLTIFLRNRVIDVLSRTDGPALIGLLSALGIGLAEETIFRGYIQPRMAAWLGDWPGLLLSAAMFALWHLMAWLGRLPVETTLILLGLTFVQGLVLGWIMRVSGHVLTPALYRAISIWLSVF